MSWFWSSKPVSAAENPKNDIYADLAPDLQAFARGDGTQSAPTPTSSSKRRPTSPQQYPAEAEGTTKSEALNAAVQDNRNRKTQINSAAMFNCALAEYELNQCFLGGSWWDRSQLCDLQKNAFWQCLESNKKALQILGYAEQGNTPAQNDKIMGLADDLCLKEAAAKQAQVVNDAEAV